MLPYEHVHSPDMHASWVWLKRQGADRLTRPLMRWDN